MADLLIQGGEVLDPSRGLRGRLDIAVSQGKITQIAPHIDPREAQRVVDVSGKVVVPGLIDLHARGIWLKWYMKMLASIKTRRPDGRVARSLSDDGELIPVGDLPDNLGAQALQDPRGFLHSTLPDHLQQNVFLFLKGQRLQRT